MKNAKIARQHIENQKRSTQPMKQERQDLLSLEQIRQLFYQTVTKINGQVDKSKTSITDIGYFLRIGELGDELMKLSLRYLEVWCSYEDCIAKQQVPYVPLETKGGGGNE